MTRRKRRAPEVGRSASIMRFHANSVSASVEGDNYQLWLDVTDSDIEGTNPREPTGQLERLFRPLGEMVEDCSDTPKGNHPADPS